MALNFSANQYESAYRSNRLQNWNLPKRHKERPSRLEGYTLFIADDRGHLFEGCRSKLQPNPWGTFMGTWEMPVKIPPSKVSMTARSAQAANHLRDWVCSSNALICAANGLRPQINGKEVRATCITGCIQQGSGRSCRCTSLPPQQKCYSGQKYEKESIRGKSQEGLTSRRLIPECICMFPTKTPIPRTSTPRTGRNAPEPRDPNDSRSIDSGKEPKSSAAVQGSAISRRCTSQPPERNRYSVDPEGPYEVPEKPVVKKSPSPNIQQEEGVPETPAPNIQQEEGVPETPAPNIQQEEGVPETPAPNIQQDEGVPETPAANDSSKVPPRRKTCPYKKK